MGVLKRKVTLTKLISEFKKYYLTTVKEAEVLPEYRLYSQFKGYDNGEENNGDEDVEDNSLVENSRTKYSETIKKISIVAFANALKTAADIYGNIVNRTFPNKNVNQHIYNLQRIESTPAYTFLLSLFQDDIDRKDILKVLKLIEAFMLRRHISEYRTAELDDIFSKYEDVHALILSWNISDKLKEILHEINPNIKFLSMPE